MSVKEVSASPFLTVGVLTRGIVSTDWAFAFRRLMLPESELIQYPGLPFDHARNQIAKAALKNGSQWLFFLDDDVLPPKDAVLKLLEVKTEIVSGLYWKRQGNIVLTAYMEAHPLSTPIQNPQSTSPMQVDYVGGGCLLIHRSVFERIKEPWFEWTVDREDLPLGKRLGEDFNFCRNARDAGFRIMLHPGVRCRHIGLGYSTEEGKFVPEDPTVL